MLNREKTMPGVRLGKSALNRQSTESQLIKQAVDDPVQFGVLYRQHVSKVYRYIYARVSSHAEAEDLTSQVFMVVLQRLPSFAPGSNFNAWLFTIARNKIVDSYRKQRSSVPLEDIQNMPLSADDPFSQLVQKELHSRLGQLVGELSQEQKELLELRFAAELSYAEIGLVIGKSEAAVKMSVYRLLDKLQEKMEKSDE